MSRALVSEVCSAPDACRRSYCYSGAPFLSALCDALLPKLISGDLRVRSSLNRVEHPE